MTNTYTENLADFGHLEQMEARNIFEAMHDNGLPSDFNNEGVKLGFNRNSGMVFLTNSECQVAVYCETERGKFLEIFYTSPYEGIEGTFDDLLEEYEHMHQEDKDWFRGIAESINELYRLEVENNSHE